MSSLFGGAQTVPQTQNTLQNINQATQQQQDYATLQAQQQQQLAQQQQQYQMTQGTAQQQASQQATQQAYNQAMTGQQTTQANPLAMMLGSGVLGNALGIGAGGVYPGMQVAPLNPYQLQALSGLFGTGMGMGSLVGTGGQMLGGGANMIAAGAAPVSAQDVQNFYNPMAGNVTNQLMNTFAQQDLANRVGSVAQTGGVGADRAAVAQGLLANQQGLAAGQIYTDLYQRALQAAQQQQGVQLQAGAGLAGLGLPTMQAGMGGIETALGAAGVPQQQQQAVNQAMYQQAMGQYQDPFLRLQAQAGVLPGLTGLGMTGTQAQQTAGQQLGSMVGSQVGSQLTSGAGSQWGNTLSQLLGTTGLTGTMTGTGTQAGTQTGVGTGTTTFPAPSIASQVGGLGLTGLALAPLLSQAGTAGKGAAASLAPLLGFSDVRAKTDIQPVGYAEGGLPLYAYRYKGDPKTYPKVVGPMAQDVAKVYPQAVRNVGGALTIDARKLQSGGEVSGSEGSDYLSDYSSSTYSDDPYYWDTSSQEKKKTSGDISKSFDLLSKAQKALNPEHSDVKPIQFPSLALHDFQFSRPPGFQSGGATMATEAPNQSAPASLDFSGVPQPSANQSILNSLMTMVPSGTTNANLPSALLASNPQIAGILQGNPNLMSMWQQGMPSLGVPPGPALTSPAGPTPGVLPQFGGAGTPPPASFNPYSAVGLSAQQPQTLPTNPLPSFQMPSFQMPSWFTAQQQRQAQPYVAPTLGAYPQPWNRQSLTDLARSIGSLGGSPIRQEGGRVQREHAEPSGYARRYLGVLNYQRRQPASQGDLIYGTPPQGSSPVGNYDPFSIYQEGGEVDPMPAEGDEHEWPGSPEGSLIDRRMELAKQTKDPETRDRLARTVHAEDPLNPIKQVTEILNRADARGQSVKQAAGDRDFYPDRTLNYPKTPDSYDPIIEDAIDKAIGARSLITDNASQNVGFGYGQGANDPRDVRTASGERYGVAKRDLPWAQEQAATHGLPLGPKYAEMANELRSAPGVTGAAGLGGERPTRLPGPVGQQQAGAGGINMPLLAAGLGMLSASGQRDARGLPMSGLAAIGQGGLAGVTQYQKQLELAQKKELAQMPYQGMTKFQEFQAGKPFPIGPNVWGQQQYGMRDAKGNLVDPRTMKPIDTSQLGEMTDQKMESMAECIANYDCPAISPYRMTTPAGAAVMELVRQKNKDYDVRFFNQSNAAKRAFATGTQGDTVRRFNTFVAHSYTLENALKALQEAKLSGDYRVFNAISQEWARQTGSGLPNTFNAIRDIYGNEAVAATVGTRNALGDREEIHKQLSAADSPQAVIGVLHAHRELAGGQMRSLKNQYEDATHAKDFENKLLPESLNALHQTKSYGGEGAPKGVVTEEKPAQKAETKPPPKEMLKEGFETRFKNGQVWMLRNGEPVRVR